MIVWAALVILLLSVIAGLVFVVVRGLQLWRNVKRTSGTFGKEMDRINEVSLQIEHQLAAAEAASARLQAAAGRLDASRARLAVQLAAVREARALVRRTFWFVPGI